MRTLLVSVLVGVVCLVLGVLAGVVGTLGVQQLSGGRATQAADRAACRGLDLTVATDGVRGVVTRVGTAAVQDSSSDGGASSVGGVPFDDAVDRPTEARRLTHFLRHADALAQRRDLGSQTYDLLGAVAGRTTTLRDDLLTPPDRLSEVAAHARALGTALDRARTGCRR